MHALSEGTCAPYAAAVSPLDVGWVCVLSLSLSPRPLLPVCLWGRGVWRSRAQRASGRPRAQACAAAQS